MRFIKGFVLLLLMVTIVSAEVVTYTTYIFFSGEQFTMAWDASEGANYYEVEGYHYEQKVPVKDESWKNIMGTQITITIPRSGHFIWKVRACAKVDVCSDWSDSSIAESTENSPWWTYAYAAPPSGGGVGG